MPHNIATLWLIDCQSARHRHSTSEHYHITLPTYRECSIAAAVAAHLSKPNTRLIKWRRFSGKMEDFSFAGWLIYIECAFCDAHKRLLMNGLLPKATFICVAFVTGFFVRFNVHLILAGLHSDNALHYSFGISPFICLSFFWNDRKRWWCRYCCGCCFFFPQ